MRALVREKFRPYHDREILQADPEGVARVLATILRPTAEAAVWSACGEAPKRKLALE